MKRSMLIKVTKKTEASLDVIANVLAILQMKPVLNSSAFMGKYSPWYASAYEMMIM